MVEQDLKAYWFETGTPTFLVNELKHHKYDIPEIEHIEVSHSVFATFEFERLVPEALLFQTGYVTIKDIQHQVYLLSYPNQEVKTALSETLLFSLAEDIESTASSQVLQLSGHLKTRDFEAFFQTVHAIFASIPYDIQVKRDEAYYHTLFYLIVSASGADAQSSVLTSKGRIDLAVILAENVCIIEFKCNQSAKAAIQQIRDNGYAEKYQCSGQTVFLMGINFSTETRNIAEWDVVPEHV